MSSAAHRRIPRSLASAFAAPKAGPRRARVHSAAVVPGHCAAATATAIDPSKDAIVSQLRFRNFLQASWFPECGMFTLFDLTCRVALTLGSSKGGRA